MTKLYPLGLYLKKTWTLVPLIISVLLNSFVWFWILWHIGPTEELVFLHYTVLFGVDFIGPWWNLLYIPITGLAIILINLCIGWIFFGKDQFIARVLQLVSILAHIFLIIATILIVFLNI